MDIKTVDGYLVAKGMDMLYLWSEEDVWHYVNDLGYEVLEVAHVID